MAENSVESKVIEGELSPSEYFEYVKGSKKDITDDILDSIYENAKHLLEKAYAMGQKRAMEKLFFQIDCITKEHELVKRGVSKFIYRQDIEMFIDSISQNPVRIIELNRYEREIPDEVAEVYIKTKDIFDEFYVLFTDYSDEHTKKTKVERKEKDPILFGCLQDNKKRIINDRFYFLGDWVDEYCDLTLSKMVSAINKKQPSKVVEHFIKTPSDIEDLRKLVEGTTKDKDGVWHSSVSVSDGSFFREVNVDSND